MHHGYFYPARSGNRATTRQTGRTKAYYLRELITKGLDDLEDYYLAAATMERVRKGEERIVTLEEAERDLGLAD